MVENEGVQIPPNEGEQDQRVGHELQGTSFDPGAAAHELQGRDKGPEAVLFTGVETHYRCGCGAEFKRTPPGPGEGVHCPECGSSNELSNPA